MIIQCPSCGSSNRVPAARLQDGPKCGQCKKKLPIDRPHHVHSEADFEELLGRAPVPVLVDFWAPWCGPCRMIAPELEKMALSKAGGLVVAKVNTDELPSLGARFDVRGIPTLVLFKSGKEYQRVSGAMSASALERALGI